MDRVSKAEREIVRKMMTKTNYDRLISKTPEELALFIHNAEAQAADIGGADTVESWINWLKSPVEEAGK